MGGMGKGQVSGRTQVKDRFQIGDFRSQIEENQGPEIAVALNGSERLTPTQS